MWSVVRFTAQKGHSGLSSLSITAEWVALVYPVSKRLMTSCSRLVIVLVFVFIMWCGLRSFIWLWSSFLIFLVVLVRVFLFSMLSSPVGDIFRCGEFLRSVLLLLCRRLLRFQVSLRDLKPILMRYLRMLDLLVFRSVEFLGSWIFFDDYSFLVVTCSGVNSVYYYYVECCRSSFVGIVFFLLCFSLSTTAYPTSSSFLNPSVYILL
jgi:hypothetical protein